MDLIYAVFRKHTTSSTKSLQNFEWYAVLVFYCNKCSYSFVLGLLFEGCMECE